VKVKTSRLLSFCARQGAPGHKERRKRRKRREERREGEVRDEVS
jgi:hypothetical protein